MRVAGGDEKLNLDLARSVEINYTCAGDSFEGTSFVCWPSRVRVLISLRACVDFTKCSLEFGSDLKNLHRGGELYGEGDKGDNGK